MRQRILIAALVLGLTVGLVGCGEDVGQKPDTDNAKIVDGKADAWNSTNNPTRFQIEFEYKYDTLKALASGRAEQPPWPSDYWSYYQDSTNVRFHGAGTLSPMEKYDVAFNGWTPNLDLIPLDTYRDCVSGLIEDKHDAYYAALGPAARWQHENKGNFAARNGRDDDSDGQTDECGDDYDGIESWWGLCHAWVPAAILEPEPQRDVTINGVTFTVSDIKALLITYYDSSAAHMLGGRCNEKEVARDEQGRLTQDECRDTNAGAFYVVITNMLGKQKRAFAEDRTGDYQVWNQPVLGYSITGEQTLTEDEAVVKLGKPSGTKYATEFNSPEAVGWRYVKMSVEYISESDATDEGPLTADLGRYTRTDRYEFIVELNKDGNVVGGEWLNYSRNTHPDFLWLPTRGYGGNPHVSYANIKNILEQSLRVPHANEPAGEVREFSDAPGAAIPDNDAAGVSRTIEIAEDIQIESLKARLDVRHSYIGDLKVMLSKDGRSAVLHDNAGGGADDIHQDWTVAEFKGTNARGTWTLQVIDSARADTGTLDKWTLTIGSGAPDETRTASWANETALSIPDNQAAGVSSTIDIPDSGTVKGLKVAVNISHTYIGDLTIALERGEQKQVLHSREGGSADDLVKSFTVTSFDGSPVQGQWVLRISDQAKQDVGTLKAWSLEATL